MHVKKILKSGISKITCMDFNDDDTKCYSPNNTLAQNSKRKKKRETLTLLAINDTFLTPIFNILSYNLAR